MELLLHNVSHKDMVLSLREQGSYKEQVRACIHILHNRTFYNRCSSTKHTLDDAQRTADDNNDVLRYRMDINQF